MSAIEKHPCFNKEAKGQYGRVHLPVAPKCNVQCNYCNRKYDCVNESRPGVTSSILSPWQSVEYLKTLTKKLKNISVIGIAGPGDPFANPTETMETFRLVKEEFPEMLFCVSTNGLELYPYIDELAELGVTHVTITMNSLNPEVLGQIYSWVRFEKKIYRGVEAGKLILEKQLACIPKLKEKGIVVKVNTIIVPGLNDDESLNELAAKIAEMGVDLMNCIPLFPTADTMFEEVEEPSKQMMKELRAGVSQYIKPMLHCARCRADAAGLLGKDDPESKCMIKEFSTMMHKVDENRTYTAVATFEGMLVNQHLGEARSFYIFKETTSGYRLVEQRKAPDSGLGDLRWEQLAEDTLSDCRALLVGGIGPKPSSMLKLKGMQIVEMTGLIDDGLDFIYKKKELKTIKKADAFKCGSSCKGTANGCA